MQVRIAALDLELRGAGNLLGGQQSGHIDAIGFDLYCTMLERTVQEMRGEEIEEDLSTQLNLNVDVRIPDEYIFDMSQQLRAYKRIASANDDEDLARIHEEISDRYGRMPESVENLFEFAAIRRAAQSLGIVSIDRIKDSFSIKLSEKAKIDPEKLMKLLEENKAASFSPTGVLKVKLEAGEVKDKQVFAELKLLLSRL